MGIRNWLDRGDGIDSWGHATLTGSGNGIFSWGHAMGAHDWLDWGVGIDSWGVAVGVWDTGWIGAMESIHGVMQHWLEWGDGIDSWGRAMGARNTGWIGAMGLIYGGYGIGLWGCMMGVHDWIGVMGLICGDVPWGSATLAGSGRWDWFVGGTWHWLDRGNGIDWLGCAMGIRDTGTGDGIDLWGCVMGARNLIRRWDWFVMAHHGGATLAGSGQWDWFMGACQMTKY